MKRLLFFSGILIIMGACSSSRVNFDQLQDRNGLFYLINEDKPFTGDVVSYSGGKVVMEGAIKNGLREGRWSNYYANGQKQMEGTYVDGMKEGTWTYWKDNGQQDKIEIYKVGQLLNNTGTATPETTAPPPPPQQTQPAQPQPQAQPAEPAKPKPQPQPKKEAPVVWERLKGGPVKYLDGIPYTGPVVKYFKDGSKELDGYFQRGHRSGKWIYYDKYGNVKDVRYY